MFNWWSIHGGYLQVHVENDEERRKSFQAVLHNWTPHIHLTATVPNVLAYRFSMIRMKICFSFFSFAGCTRIQVFMIGMRIFSLGSSYLVFQGGPVWTVAYCAECAVSTSSRVFVFIPSVSWTYPILVSNPLPLDLSDLLQRVSGARFAARRGFWEFDISRTPSCRDVPGPGS